MLIPTPTHTHILIVTATLSIHTRTVIRTLTNMAIRIHTAMTPRLTNIATFTKKVLRTIMVTTIRPTDRTIISTDRPDIYLRCRADLALPMCVRAYDQSPSCAYFLATRRWLAPIHDQG